MTDPHTEDRMLTQLLSTPNHAGEWDHRHFLIEVAACLVTSPVYSATALICTCDSQTVMVSTH